MFDVGGAVYEDVHALQLMCRGFNVFYGGVYDAHGLELLGPGCKKGGTDDFLGPALLRGFFPGRANDNGYAGRGSLFKQFVQDEPSYESGDSCEENIHIHSIMRLDAI